MDKIYMIGMVTKKRKKERIKRILEFSFITAMF